MKNSPVVLDFLHYIFNDWRNTCWNCRVRIF